MLVILQWLDELALSPGIAENKDIICCDTKDDKDSHLIHGRVHGDLEDSRVDQVRHGEAQEDHQHDKGGHKETFQVEPDEEEDEGAWENCIRDVACKHFFELDVPEQVSEGFSHDRCVACVLALW